jgi:hypothetical protein
VSHVVHTGEIRIACKIVSLQTYKVGLFHRWEGSFEVGPKGVIC